MQKVSNPTCYELLKILIAETHLLSAKKKLLQDLFKKHHTMQDDEPVKQWLDSLLIANQEFAVSSGSATQIRQHNIFVHAFIAPNPIPYKVLAGINYISRRQVDRDINAVMSRMLKFAFGVGGIAFE